MSISCLLLYSNNGVEERNASTLFQMAERTHVLRLVETQNQVWDLEVHQPEIFRNSKTYLQTANGVTKSEPQTVFSCIDFTGHKTARIYSEVCLVTECFKSVHLKFLTNKKESNKEALVLQKTACPLQNTKKCLK